MSSRNLRLSGDERKQASLLFKNLSLARQALLDGGSWEDVRHRAIAKFKEGKDIRLEYFELVDAQTLNTRLTELDKAILLTAAFVGTTRLIDNLSLT
jgi:pantoate--beta-alanine ligase